MTKINLQEKTKILKGSVEKYVFENLNIGIEETLFHRVELPLVPFDSGLEYMEQPEETSIMIEWLDLKLDDPTGLDGLKVTSKEYVSAECSIYIGGAHNPCDINKLIFEKIEEDVYAIDCQLLVDFESEGVAQNETFEFQTTVEFVLN